MIIYTFLTTTLLLALLSFLLLLHNYGKPVIPTLHQYLLSLSLGLFIYLYGTWVFLSVYAKEVFGICMLITLFLVIMSKKTILVPTGKRKPIASLVFTMLLSLLCILYYTGTTGKPYGIAHLSLPFKSGTYFVFQGGKGLPTNIFHYGLRSAIYAMDIIKLNSAGNRAGHIFSTRLQDYAIFGDTIYSPCSGIVMHAVSDNPDNTPPDRTRGPHNTNNVLLETNSMYVFMGHMKEHSVLVHEGDTVLQGQPLGLVGNSGFSLEPHLHIQAHAKTDTTIPWYKAPPLWINFDNKEYLLFQEIHAHNN